MNSDIFIHQNSKTPINILVVDANGEPLVFDEGYQFDFSVARDTTSDNIVNLQLGSGIEYKDPEEGQLSISLDSVDFPADQLVYQFRIDDGTSSWIALEGRMFVSPSLIVQEV